MPELPEIETIRRGLEPAITQQRIVSCWRSAKRLRYADSLEILTQPLGMRIHSVQRRGKYLLLRIGDGTLLMHLGMSGSVRLYRQSLFKLGKHDHYFLRMNDCVMVFHDVRRFGFLLWIHRDWRDHALIKSLGPEPGQLSLNELREHCKKSNRAVKSVLMDAKTVVGVGNIYANEALFQARIHPATPAKLLQDKQLSQLRRAIRVTIAQAIQAGGTTLKDFCDSQGKPGYFQQKLSVYGRANEPCRVCSQPIARIVLSQRATFFCARCQKRTKPPT